MIFLSTVSKNTRMSVEKLVNDFVRQFLSDHVEDENALEAWDDHLPKFKALMKGNESFAEFPKKTRQSKPKSTTKPAASEKKRPRSGYLIFTCEIREKVKSEHPELGPREVMAVLGKRWKELSPENKDLYLKMAADEKAKA